MGSNLARPVLILNKSWTVINVMTAQDALVSLYKGHAKVVCPETYQLYSWNDWREVRKELSVKTVKYDIPIPEVILCTNTSSIPKNSVVFSRRNVFLRDKHHCQYCNIKIRGDDATLDHVTPRALGGVSSWTNCVLACTKCNAKKADKTLQQAGMKLLKEPIKPKWSPHYAAQRFRLKSWDAFVSEMFWSVPLQE